MLGAVLDFKDLSLTFASPHVLPFKVGRVYFLGLGGVCRAFRSTLLAVEIDLVFTRRENVASLSAAVVTWKSSFDELWEHILIVTEANIMVLIEHAKMVVG